MSFEEARKVCKLRVAQSKDFACVQLVYGHAGEEISRLQMTSIPLSFLSSSSLFSLFSLSLFLLLYLLLLSQVMARPTTFSNS